MNWRGFSDDVIVAILLTKCSWFYAYAVQTVEHCECLCLYDNKLIDLSSLNANTFSVYRCLASLRFFGIIVKFYYKYMLKQ